MQRGGYYGGNRHKDGGVLQRCQKGKNFEEV
jgi:hypothetical protein